MRPEENMKKRASLIPIFRGKEADNNRVILRELSLRKMTAWQLAQRVFEAVHGQQPLYEETDSFRVTISKRLKALEQLRFVCEADQVVSKGTKVLRYVSTAKGAFVAMWIYPQLRLRFHDIHTVCLRNPNYDVPLFDSELANGTTRESYTDFADFFLSVVPPGAQAMFVKFVYIDAFTEMLRSGKTDIEHIDDVEFFLLISQVAVIKFEKLLERAPDDLGTKAFERLQLPPDKKEEYARIMTSILGSLAVKHRKEATDAQKRLERYQGLLKGIEASRGAE